jgi:hypothetical protein
LAKDFCCLKILRKTICKNYAIFILSFNAIQMPSKRSQPWNFNDWGKSFEKMWKNVWTLQITLKFLQRYPFSPQKMHIFVKFRLFIYRFMHNLLGLFAKCLINLEKQKHSSRWNFTVLPRFLIYFFGHVLPNDNFEAY